MSDSLRTLNDAGIAVFSSYLESLRNSGTGAPPFSILTDPAFSEEFSNGVHLDQQIFADAFEFGSYLDGVLASLDRREIPYNHKLWSWLALYFFDQICPAVSGKRTVLEDATYILARKFNHQRYYRHLVRTPWMAVANNKDNAKILLQTKSGGKRSDIFEQLASRQQIFGNPTIIAGAYKLYYDAQAKAPKRGASGKGAGSPRRLAVFIKQIHLTYDLRACSSDQFIDLLPKEYDRFKGVVVPKLAAKKSTLKNLLSKVIPGATQNPPKSTMATD